MIRKYIEKDIEEIMNVWIQASNLAHPFLDYAFAEKSENDIRNIYMPIAETWVYEENNSVIGFISMIGNEIGGLFVLPDSQSNGIGTKLVDFILHIHKELEVEVFEKNVIGRAFYDKYGFEQIKKYFHTESNNEVLRLKFKS
jgi:putative acetyltransferase